VALDPVCKMFVDIEKTDKIIQHKDSKYFFCSTFCMKLFEKNTNKYLTDKITQQQRSSK